MNPKLIIVPFSGHDRELPVLEYAFSLAKIHDAHTEIWHTAPDPNTAFTPYTPYDIPIYPDKTITELKEISESNKKKAEKKFLLLKEKHKIEKASFHTAIGYTGAILSIRGRVADLIILCRDPNDIGFMDDAHEILFGSGRPVLFFPPGYKIKNLTGKTLLAWNSSVEAAHAVAFSMPWLTRGEATVLTKQDGEERKFPLSAEDLAQYLHRHGIETNILNDLERKIGLPAFILESAKKINAEMIVMGAYSHSRLRENILGGVTKYMLENADMPVFMAH